MLVYGFSMHLRKPNKVLTKSFFSVPTSFQPLFPSLITCHPHWLAYFLKSMPGSSMTQIHQKCIFSYLLTCLAKLYSSLKFTLNITPLERPVLSHTHIVLLYPFSQSSLFIFFFIALITFNFTHI